jgi:hypothetical protein
VLRRNKVAVGYRGWAITGGKRVFGPTRQDPDKAHDDAKRMREKAATESGWGGTLETRAKEWLAAIAVRVTEDTVAFYQGKLANIYATIPKTMPVERITAAVVREFVREARDEKKLSARTIQHCRRTLNCLFRWMVRRGIATTNPIGEVDWPSPKDTRPDVFTEPELVVKLIDFGLVVPNTPNFQAPGNRTGTAAYMAPELVRRQRTDARIYKYAYAVTC